MYRVGTSFETATLARDINAAKRAAYVHGDPVVIWKRQGKHWSIILDRSIPDKQDLAVVLSRY